MRAHKVPSQMPPTALVFSNKDAPPEDKLLAVDTGLEQHNHSAAPLNEVRQLAAFATDEAGTVVGGAIELGIMDRRESSLAQEGTPCRT